MTTYDEPVASQTSELLHCDHRTNFTEFRVANTRHHHQVLGAAKRPVLPAVRRDSFSDNLAYSRKLFKLIRRSHVNVHYQSALRVALIDD